MLTGLERHLVYASIHPYSAVLLEEEELGQLFSPTPGSAICHPPVAVATSADDVPPVSSPRHPFYFHSKIYLPSDLCWNNIVINSPGSDLE